MENSFPLRLQMPIEEIFLRRLMEVCNNCFIIGGMPECVASWIKYKDPAKVAQIQRELIEIYENDFSKHNGKVNSGRILMVFRSIVSQLAKANEKFMYGAVREGGRARDFEEAIEWLVSARMLNRVYNISKMEHPLAAFDKLDQFKLFVFDTGLLKQMAGIDNSAILLKSDYQFKGPLTENFILQQLRGQFEVEPRYYSDKNGEIDFVVQYGAEIIPIEAKGGENKSAPSFKRYIAEHQPEHALRFSKRGYRKDGHIYQTPAISGEKNKRATLTATPHTMEKKASISIHYREASNYMSNEKVFQMDFGKVYGLLLNKAVNKGRTQTEVDEIICWLTGYDAEALEAARLSPVCYGDFFRNAPAPNPYRTLIKGVVCGIRVEEIEDPLMREIRYLDKLIDELAKGKPMEKILRNQEEPAMWVCPKCGRSFRRKDQDHYCGKAPVTIAEYIRSQPEDVQPYLHQVNDAIKASIPEAKEKISWSMPTYWKGCNLIQFAAFKKHIGLYPGPEAVEAFADRLTDYKTSKGAIQFPYSEPLPLELIREIAAWCEKNSQK